MPILDGRPVPACDIDPARHRFIGMWRPPELVVLTGNYFRARWAEGLYDEPQYVSINPYVQDACEPQGFTESVDDVDCCWNCVFWHREEQVCRRKSPSPGNDGRANWPLTGRADWCGEYEGEPR